MLAIVFALQRLRHYLLGASFILYTDHKALVDIIACGTKLSNILASWLDIILEYDFSVVHRPGLLNILPDHLSRLFEDLSFVKCSPVPDGPDQSMSKSCISLSLKEVVTNQPVLLSQFIRDRFNKRGF